MSAPDELLPDPLPAEPDALIADWLAAAVARSAQPNPNAMVLATVDAAGKPSARVVLCKDWVREPGYLLFYTNYESRKGEELAATGRAAAVFHWDDMHRQLRVEGRVVRSPPHESDRYFATRSWGSRLGAWASRQSRPIASRAALLVEVAKVAARFGAQAVIGRSVPRPAHWGGFRFWVEAVEFWTEGEFRIHDRVRYARGLTPQGEGFSAGTWTLSRLQP
ncbi:MAG TPA: pyridoxamine 5'-phosphate oxidase [Steroidobacteraceae bacterium]|nr:pyridoxamine 5'-phosphate oxidase [Steroidobacteraceae bacterium]